MALLELRQPDGQQCKTLTYVVVKLSGDPPTFLLLRLDQLAAHTRERSVRQFAPSDVDEGHHTANNLLPSTLGIAPVFGRETRSIRTP